MAVGHAERLVPMIAEVMADAGVSFAGLSFIAVTCGPGTFTGVRTGVAAARGLALATGLPLLAMTSLALIAHGAAAEIENACAGGLAVCMDAGKGQIFAQLFQCSPRRPTLSSVDTAPICGPMLTTIGEFAALLAAGRGVGPTTVVGSAAVVVAMKATESGVDVLAADRPGLPSARHLHGADLKPFSPARPLYLRLPDAVPPVDLSLPRASP